MATAKLQRCLVLQAQATLHQPPPQHHGKGHRLPARLSAPEPDSPRRWAQQKVTVRVRGNGASGRPSFPRRRHLPPSSPMPKQGTRKPPHHDWTRPRQDAGQSVCACVLLQQTCPTLVMPLAGGVLQAAAHHTTAAAERPSSEEGEKVRRGGTACRRPMATKFRPNPISWRWLAPGNQLLLAAFCLPGPGPPPPRYPYARHQHHHTTTDLPAGQGTDKQEPPLSQAYLATQRPSAIHSQAARRASPRSRFRTGAPVFVCFASSKDHPSDGQTYRCPKPTIGSCSDFAASPHLIPPLSNTRLLTLGFPKVP